MFLECIGKTGLPGFGSSRQATLSLSGARRRLPKNCASEDQKLTAGCILNKTRTSDMEIPDKKDERRWSDGATRR
jgi:hypothetical protein